MPLFLKKISFSIIFNLSLFLFLMLGIQNSKEKSKVDFVINKTIDLPISFISGVSFISGSFAYTFLSIILNKKVK